MAEQDWDNTNDSMTKNAARLYFHLIEKGFQAGGVVGLGLVLPILAYRRRGGKNSVNSLLRAQGTSSLVGVGTTCLLMGPMKISKWEDKAAGFQDRAYRLHFNQSQNRADTFAHIGMAAGAISSYALSVSPLALIGGSSVGAVLGLIAHVSTASRTESGSPNQMIEEMNS